MEDQTNPWARANVFHVDERTLELVHPDKRPEYLQVTCELFQASYQLNEIQVVYNAAQERYHSAVEARINFKNYPDE